MPSICDPCRDFTEIVLGLVSWLSFQDFIFSFLLSLLASKIALLLFPPLLSPSLLICALQYTNLLLF